MIDNEELANKIEKLQPNGSSKYADIHCVRAFHEGTLAAAHFIREHSATAEPDLFEQLVTKVKAVKSHAAFDCYTHEEIVDRIVAVVQDHAIKIRHANAATAVPTAGDADRIDPQTGMSPREAASLLVGPGLWDILIRNADLCADAVINAHPDPRLDDRWRLVAKTLMRWHSRPALPSAERLAKALRAVEMANGQEYAVLKALGVTLYADAARLILAALAETD